ncbi:hypothetical protein DR950_18070 [Kitasatospora xanthocidica]|uniref:Uncharacterized protein n=1 Tax=Kitasatospora xanthocidica TaxID=83382 RepID=A0A372ZU50_9ACTN|nr:hypothetical protein [Kitasatospora xanthocidica]RGD59446.1 hypothetical protein DR950_18070 [Kitasatospora xanthocidica]
MSLRIAASAEELRRRCEATSVRTTTGEDGYEDGAVVPTGLWRPLTDDLCLRVAASVGGADGTLVELVDAAAIERHLLTAGHVTPLGRADSPAHALTTTPNYRDGRRIGLHLDNWDKLAYQDKASGRRRLCVNLGPGTRHLLVCDIDIQQVCRAVRPDYATCHPHTDDLRAYAAAGLPMTCLRIRLAPGDGYLAPTEFLPHDGSTENCASPSTAAFWLGHWPRGAFDSGRTR